jgi:hypothetical protein
MENTVQSWHRRVGFFDYLITVSARLTILDFIHDA